jgi:hypothetical protein
MIRKSQLKRSNKRIGGNKRLPRLGKSTASASKRRIQALLRQIVIIRDGGCILRVVLGKCSDVLQAEHLRNRQHSKTYGDLRNIVCLCQYHHIFWKKQNERLYWELIEQHLGKERWDWLKEQEKDHTPYKANWIGIEEGLKAELALLSALTN